MLLSIILWPISGFLFILFLFLGIFSGLFFLLSFRQYNRIAKYEEKSVYSCCDGLISKIKKITPERSLYSAEKEVWCVTITPVFHGSNMRLAPSSGKFLPWQSIASEPNFSIKVIDFKIQEIKTVASIQRLDNKVIGWVDYVKDIVCLDFTFCSPFYYSIDTDNISVGKHIGIAPFCRSVDLYIPTDFELLVEEGQTVIAGETSVAEIKTKLLEKP
jgi:phosphatidylserine decarboxylase